MTSFLLGPHQIQTIYKAKTQCFHNFTSYFFQVLTFETGFDEHLKVSLRLTELSKVPYCPFLFPGCQTSFYEPALNRPTASIPKR